ncbi:sigma-70 family RNA polymerase sigma factor [Phytohabitans kaempferiae]|uniref:Sigma-70 family RNA polymerase sigma factor n=1 Tax=Phytohabitans kaempferiae TaxID=1620943 RepID=A0ABV6MDG8_9ACTN
MSARDLEARPAAGRGRHARSVPGPAGRPLHRTGIHRAEGGLLRSLYDQHAEPLLMIALSLTGGDRRLAEDVVRETLATAWREVDQIDVAASSLRPWLISIAQRIIEDMRGYPFGEEPPAPVERLPLDEYPDDFGPEMRRMLVLDGLRSLPGPDREILVEAYFRGRGVRDVADDLGLPPETVKWRLFFALRALQKLLVRSETADA